MAIETTDVPSVSHTVENGADLIDAAELAARWNVPESWIRNHTRARTPKAERIPCIRLGRYIRFQYRSPALEAWLDAHRDSS